MNRKRRRTRKKSNKVFIPRRKLSRLTYNQLELYKLDPLYDGQTNISYSEPQEVPVSMDIPLHPVQQEERDRDYAETFVRQAHKNRKRAFKRGDLREAERILKETESLEYWYNRERPMGNPFSRPWEKYEVDW